MIDPSRLHKAIGDCVDDALRVTAKAYNWRLLRKFKVCEDCAIGKAKKKNTKKHCLHGSKIQGERLYIDISSIKSESYGGSTFWALIN